MKITTKKIRELVEGFNELIDKEMPISLSYRIQRNAVKINKESELIHQMTKKIIDKYKDDELSDSDKIVIKEEFRKKFGEEMEELEEQEIEVDLDLLNLKELEVSGVSIKPASLMLLEPIIEFEEDK